MRVEKIKQTQTVNPLSIVSSGVEPPPFLKEPLPPPFHFGYPLLSEANLKSYPLFLRAIQSGACKLHKTV